MKKYMYRLPVKLLCLILALFSIFMTVVSAFSVAFLLYFDAYRQSPYEFQSRYLSERYDYLTYSIYHVVREEGYFFPDHLEMLRRSVPFRCTVICDGSQIYTDFAGEEGVACLTRSFSDTDVYYGGRYSKDYTVRVYLQEPEAGTDFDVELFVLKALYDFRLPLIFAFLIGLVLSIFLCVFLCCSAGRCGQEEPKVGFFDRIPLEIGLACGLFLVLLEMAVANEISPSLFLFLWLAGIVLVLDIVYGLLLLMTLATRIKTHTLQDSSFCGRLWRLLKSSRKWFLRLWENIRLTPKVAIGMVLLGLVDFFAAAAFDWDAAILLYFLEGLVFTAVLIFYTASLRRLEKDLEKIAEGKLDTRSDLTLLPPGLRSFGEKMNRSAQGLEAAVEEKMRSERFKTELITNVSHDIKTPLTSIVNYVDLMKKEPIEDQTLIEYLDVLDRQSKRLKKLTEDLVESSKAASGAISVDLQPCNAGVLLEQAMGEHQAALEEAGLRPQLQLPDEEVFILADGKRLWRVMDNLFQNIKKYALPGTRVYVSLEVRGNFVDMVFRNISAEAITVSAEELTERFVRGDASRNSDGSGLGLSIARSLVQLQKGQLSLTVDGDLFKAVITFPRRGAK